MFLRFKPLRRRTRSSAAHGAERAYPAWLWWVTGTRATLALTLSVTVLLSDLGRQALANFIAVFWLVGALASLRESLATPSPSRARVSAAVLGAGAAMLVLSRAPLRHVVATDTLLAALGVAAVMTGVLRLAGGIRDDLLVPARPRMWRRLLLGGFEVVLGAVLILAQDVGRGVALIVAGWGIVGGTTLMLDALAMRRADSSAR